MVRLSRLTKLFACMPRMRDIVVAHAVYSGYLSVLTRLAVDVVRAVEMPLLDLAASMGHLKVLKYLHADVGHNGCTTWAVDSAVHELHFDIVAYLLANRQEGCSWRGIVRAATYGHLNLVKSLHTFKPLSSNILELALEAATMKNRWEIVSYVVGLFGPAKSHSNEVMDQAARSGNLELVQFLHERNFPCSTLAMDWAAGNGHLGVVKWLHENRTEGFTEDAIDSAASYGP